jgi:hypothetical protein
MTSAAKNFILIEGSRTLTNSAFLGGVIFREDILSLKMVLSINFCLDGLSASKVLYSAHQKFSAFKGTGT